MQEAWKKFTIPTKNRHRFCGICITDGGYAYTGYEVRKMKKEQESTVSLDLASYNVVNDNHQFLKDLIYKYVDIVFANEDESFAYTHLNPEESVENIAGQCDIAIVKVGKRGSYVRQGGQLYHIGAITSNCLDSTGAGDLYAGGFLHALSDGFDLRRCGEIGTIAAGRVVEIVGTKLPDETWYFTRFEAKDTKSLRMKKIKLRKYGFKGNFDKIPGFSLICE